MPSETCKSNITKKKGQYCDEVDSGWCFNAQQNLDVYCHDRKLAADTPVPQSYKEDGVWKTCYCCCSCFAFNTPIQVGANAFKAIQDIQIGEAILATGPSLSGWTPHQVTELGGMVYDVPVDFMYTLQVAYPGNETRTQVVTPDHLYLLPDGKLRAVQDLRPGDRIRTANGDLAMVTFAIPGQYQGGVRHIALGPWKPGDPLDGHLINANGLVTADLSVQLAYYGGLLGPQYIAADPEEYRPAPGTAEFALRYNSVELREFIADKKRWPAGFVPLSEALINIPAAAVSYFTPEQAADIQRNIPQSDPGNSGPLSTVRYLFNVYKGFYPEPNYLIDWNNHLPNAYFFYSVQQPFIVVTGGLARLDVLGRDGLALILSHMVAASQGHPCVGPADYEGVLLYLRETWEDDLFTTVLANGLEQLEAVIQGIDPDHAGPGPDICAQPSLACRLEAITAAAAMRNMPQCAVPHPVFRVTDATPDKLLRTVTVSFNEVVNPPTAQTASNYAISPAAGAGPDAAAVVTVKGAKIVGDNYLQVQLSVSGMAQKTAYRLTVSDVLDEHGHPISPDGNSVEFATP